MADSRSNTWRERPTQASLVSPDWDLPLFQDSPEPRDPSPAHTVANYLTLRSETSKNCCAINLVFRIVRAFLIEEVKQMKRLMQQKERSTKKTKKTKSKGKKKTQWGGLCAVISAGRELGEAARARIWCDTCNSQFLKKKFPIKLSLNTYLSLIYYYIDPFVFLNI